MTVLILHGVAGHAGKYWMQWLGDELVGHGHKVIMPTLPDPGRPDRNTWLREIKKLVKDENINDLVIVGHSLGVPAALDYLETVDTPIKTLISVSGFYEDYGLELNSYYMAEKEINMAKVKKNIGKSFVIYGDNDPYVPQKTLESLARALKVNPEIIKNGGHFNADTEFKDKFPRLLQVIDSLR